MRMGRRGTGAFVLFFLIVLSAQVMGASTCLKFLKIPTVPRIAAMGEAVTAVPEVTYAEANPANLIGVDGSLTTFSHTSWYEDISLETLTFGTSSGRNAFGLSVVGLYTDKLDRYNEYDEYEGTFRYFDFSISGTYARQVLPRLNIGVTAKTLYEKIDWSSATGFAVDLGASYSAPLEAARGYFGLGATVRNLGPKMSYQNSDFDLPLSFQAGVSYLPAWLPEDFQAVVAVDYEKTRDYDGGVVAGLEVGFSDILALRVGQSRPYAEGEISFGGGVRLGPTLVDYAYMDLGNDLGNTHRISVAFAAGGILPTPRESR
jgi:hypothetical protein